MAVGTLVSRGTGFLRTLVLAAALGTSFLGNAYNNANTLPNTVYYLMLGGIFTSVVVPLLVRAAKRDPDRGEAYAQRMFTLGALALLAVTLLATAVAAPLVHLYAPTFTGSQYNVTVVWAYFFIPQIFFYGMSSLIGAILNTRGRFAAPMWTPVINNLVVIVFGGLYVVTVGLHKTPGNISAFGVQLLGIGTTLGVVAQTVALLPSLRAAGFRWRPTLGFRAAEVTEMGRMAGWMSFYVITQWAGYLVVQRVANAASAGSGGYSAYSIAWQLFQLPYAIVGISVITALLPRMSEHASARRYSLVRDDFSIGVRLASVLVVPAAIYLAVLGGPLAEFLFSYARQHARAGEIHRRGLRPVLPRPGPLYAHPAAAAGVLLVPGQPDRRLGRPAHHVRQHRRGVHRQGTAPRRRSGRRAGHRVRARERGRHGRRLGAAAAPGGQPGRMDDRPQPDQDAPGDRARAGLRARRDGRRGTYRA